LRSEGWDWIAAFRRYITLQQLSHLKSTTSAISHKLDTSVSQMAGKKAAGENTKKAAGNARKAEVAAQKAAAENQKKAAAEDEEWGKGAKSNAKK
jgi:hypothetical protein